MAAELRGPKGDEAFLTRDSELSSIHINLYLDDISWTQLEISPGRCTVLHAVVIEANIITRNHQDSKASGVTVHPAVDLGLYSENFILENHFVCDVQNRLEEETGGRDTKKS